MPLDQDDKLLREFLEDHSEEAFCDLVGRHADLVARVVHKRVSQPEAAQEIVQNVFALLARKASKLIKHPTITGWLIKTAIFETRKYQRTEAARMRHESIHANLKQIMESQTAFQEEEFQRVEDALSALSAPHRDAVLMRYYQKASYLEIGGRFGKSDDAAQKMVSRAVDRLRRLLNRDQPNYSYANTTALLGSLFAAKSIAMGTTSTIAINALNSATTVTHSSLLINTLYSAMTASQIKGTLALGLAATLPFAYHWSNRQVSSKPKEDNTQTIPSTASQEIQNNETTVSVASETAWQRLNATGSSPINTERNGEQLSGMATSGDSNPPVDWPTQRAKKLILDLSDSEWKIRRGAAALLNGSNIPAALAVPALTAALQDDEWQVRKPVADALASYGAAAVEATPELARLLKDEEWHVRESAAFALSKIGPGAEPAVPELSEALYDEEWHVRRGAAEGLAAIGPGASPAVHDLIESLGDDEWQVRNPAAHALANIGAEAAPAVEALERALRDEEWPVAAKASTALGNIGASASSSVASLLNALDHQESQVREAAAIALGAIGHETLTVIERLQSKIIDPAPAVGQAAVEAIQRIESLNQ